MRKGGICGFASGIYERQREINHLNAKRSIEKKIPRRPQIEHVDGNILQREIDFGLVRLACGPIGELIKGNLNAPNASIDMAKETNYITYCTQTP